MAKIGDFAIAKFDGGKWDKSGRPLNYHKVPCVITGRSSSNPNEQEFVYWERNSRGKLVVREDSLPKNRLETTGLDLAYIGDWEVFDSVRKNNIMQNISGNKKPLKAFKSMMGI